MEKLQVKTLVIIIIFIVCTILIALFGIPNSTKVKNNKSVSPPPTIPITLTLTPSPSALIVSPSPSINQVSVTSPDGKLTLSTITEKGKDSTTKTFSILRGDTTEKTIYITTFPNSTTVKVPFNTFSPNNKYLYIQEKKPEKVSYFVFSTDGKPLTPDQSLLEISEIFGKKYPEFIITDVTGWAGPYLLVINTNKTSGEVGPSFWYDLSSRSFIRLSTRFN